MPPKITEQHKRDQNPDDKHGNGKMGENGPVRKNSDDESKMEKLKDKMGRLIHSDEKDNKNYGKKADEQESKGRERSKSRSRSRERKVKNQSPDRKKQDGKNQKGRSRSGSQERKGRNQSPDRKGRAAGPSQHQQQPMKTGAGFGAGSNQGAGQGPGKGPGQQAHQQKPGQGFETNVQRQHAGPGAGVGADAAAGVHANQKSRTKRGLCWPVENKKDDPSRFTRPGSKVSWIYNWSPHPTKGAEGLQFVPMQWNAGGIKELNENVKRTGAKTVLAFNEPELQDQANMKAEDAAEQWIKHIEPLRKQGIRCGSPGISNAGHAVQWMQDFWSRIKKQGSDVDFWCFHWYGADLGPFYDYIWSTHHQLDSTKKVWITEFAATNWNRDNPLPKDVVEKFARESFKYLDSLDWVERYCWFGPKRDIGNVGRFARLYNDEGNLTDVGKIFRDE